MAKALNDCTRNNRFIRKEKGQLARLPFSFPSLPCRNIKSLPASGKSKRGDSLFYPISAGINYPEIGGGYYTKSLHIPMILTKFAMQKSNVYM